MRGHGIEIGSRSGLSPRYATALQGHSGQPLQVLIRRARDAAEGYLREAGIVGEGGYTHVTARQVAQAKRSAVAAIDRSLPSGLNLNESGAEARARGDKARAEVQSRPGSPHIRTRARELQLAANAAAIREELLQASEALTREFDRKSRAA